MKLIAFIIIILFSLEAEAAVHLLKGSLIEKRRYPMGSSHLELVYDSRSLQNSPWGFGWCSNLEPDCVQYYNLSPFSGVHPTSHTSQNGKYSTFHTSQGEWIRLSFLNDNLVGLKHSLAGEETFRYDDQHNLTQITFSDLSTKDIQYNKDLDLVLSVRGRGPCFEKYIYNREQMQSISTTVQRFCVGEKTKTSKYDFYYKISQVEEDRLLRMNVVHL